MILVHVRIVFRIENVSRPENRVDFSTLLVCCIIHLLNTRHVTVLSGIFNTNKWAAGCTINNLEMQQSMKN